MTDGLDTLTNAAAVIVMKLQLAAQADTEAQNAEIMLDAAQLIRWMVDAITDTTGAVDA